METLTQSNVLAAFARLDGLIPKRVSLITGGGGAMLLAHNFPLATYDVDAVPKGMSMEELKPMVEQVARELALPPDWLNPWFASFTNVLPADYTARLKNVFSGKFLEVLALGIDDLLLMKCFAHRKKDVPHARALIRKGAKTNFVERRIEELAAQGIPGTNEAMEFLEDVIDMEEA